MIVFSRNQTAVSIYQDTYMYYMILTFLQVLEETGFDMSFFADPDAYLEHNFQDHQVRV